MDEQGLEIHHDERHQRNEWRLEKAGWSAIALLLVMALAGLLGAGPISEGVRKEGGLALDYRRFVHRQGPEQLVVRIGPDLAQGGKARVWLDQSFVEGVEFQHVDPVPDAVEAANGRYVWVFAVATDTQPVVVVFRYLPDFYGRREARLGMDGGPSVAFWQFAFP